jgi:hypothetical protein
MPLVGVAEGEEMIKERLICWLKDHDDHIETQHIDEQHFISLGQCQRCKRQWWMRGEVGKFKGVRFVRTKEVESRK